KISCLDLFHNHGYKRRMKTSLSHILKMVLIGILLTLSALTADAADTWKGQVVSVIDGDTITVKHSDSPKKIRLYGIDAPEKQQPFGQDAYKFIFSKVNMKTVEVKPIKTEQYGRSMAYVYYGKDKNRKCLNEEILKAGLAWHYKDSSKDQNLADLEKEARTKKVGLWAPPIPPWEFRAGKTGGIKELHGNTATKVYHKASCKDYDCDNCTAIFKSNKEAEAAGYRPCGKCKPGK
ncbi:MAG TPA: hypothetical protein DCQ37_24005, partial [Desulfobacteraceae bacterium]|nr:hypothetical protein [Desulfobacteraceae bacterium]